MSYTYCEIIDMYNRYRMMALFSSIHNIAKFCTRQMGPHKQHVPQAATNVGSLTLKYQQPN